MCFDPTQVNFRDSSFDPTPSRVICGGDSRAEHLQYIRTRPWRDDVVTGGVVVRGPWSGRGVTGTPVNTQKGGTSPNVAAEPRVAKPLQRTLSITKQFPEIFSRGGFYFSFSRSLAVHSSSSRRIHVSQLYC